MAPHIVRGGAKVLAILVSGSWIGLFEQLLVGDRRLLHELDDERPASPLVAIERRFIGLFGRDQMQRVGELHRVVDATVETEAADWIVDVRGIAREKHAALAERRRDALVHFVQISVDEVVRLRGRHDSLQSCVRGFVTERLLVGFVATTGDDDDGANGSRRFSSAPNRHPSGLVARDLV